jgi:hypothetical protein
MKPIKDILAEYKMLMAYKDDLTSLCKGFTQEKVRIAIGGSYALKYMIPSFAEREVHDYDFIIRTTTQGVVDIKQGLARLSRLGLLIREEGSSSEAIPLAKIMGKKAEILFKNCSDRGITSNAFETPRDILEIKKEYCEKRTKQGVPPRAKDLEDIEKIKEYLDPLPF